MATDLVRRCSRARFRLTILTFLRNDCNDDYIYIYKQKTTLQS